MENGWVRRESAKEGDIGHWKDRGKLDSRGESWTVGKAGDPVSAEVKVEAKVDAKV